MALQKLTTATQIGAGSIVQVVANEIGSTASTTSLMPDDDTIPQNSEGAEFYTLSITPKSSSNTLKIDVNFFCSVSGAVRSAVIALFQDSTANALVASSVTDDINHRRVVSFTHIMTAGTTSSTTFKVRGGPDSGNTLQMNGDASNALRLYGGVASSSIVITEIAT